MQEKCPLTDGPRSRTSKIEVVMALWLVTSPLSGCQGCRGRGMYVALIAGVKESRPPWGF